MRAAAAAAAASSSAQPAGPGVGTVFNKVAVPKAEPWKAKRKLSDAQLLAQAEEAAGAMRPPEPAPEPEVSPEPEPEPEPEP